jgi:hypothetical protein
MKDIRNIFIDEIKKTFKQDLDWNAVLDKKSVNMVWINVIPIILSTIFFHNSVLFLTTIMISLISILFGLGSLFVTRFAWPYGHEAFFKEDGEYNEDVVNQFLYSDVNNFKEHLVESYLNSIKENLVKLNRKAKYIKYSQYTFGLSVVLLILSLVVINI